jgi:bla regulator protein BlaR1
MCGRWNKPHDKEMAMLCSRLNWIGLLPVLGLVAASAACAQAPGNGKQPQPGAFDISSCSKPAYPHGEQAAGHEGIVTMAFRIETSGAVSASRIVRSSGFPALDEAARSALTKCRFTPARTPDGKPAPAWTAVQYVWEKD